MADVLFRNATLFDGSGAATRPADVIVRGNRIRTVADASARLEAPGCEVVDASGLTLMPGMTEGHAHLSFCGASKNTDLGDIPPEEHLLGTLRNAELLLDHGFTSCYSAASAKLRLDIVVRNEVNAGRLKGPRIRASSPEITVTGGLGDECKMHQNRSSFGMTCDGAEEVRKAARICIREGTDNIKINISGDDFVNPAKGGMTVMSEAEVRAAVETAHDFGKRVNCHARAGGSVKRALECDVDVIYHCELMDARALDMMEAKKDSVFAGPAIGLIVNTIEYGPQYGIDEAAIERLGMRRVVELTAKVYAELRKRGVRVVIGGDYGFAWTPQGTNARDLMHFVDLFGYSPAEALCCATKVGGEIMGMGDELGLVREGFLADLLLVDGDPTRDVRIMQDRARLVGIMKDGAFHKHPRDAVRAGAAVAAE
jgi:imidazolonepropionase-like amidohydrolase